MNDMDVVLNTSIISYFRTGNPLFDGVIMMFMASISSYLFGRKHIFYRNIKKAFTCCFTKKFKYKMRLLAFENSANRRLPIIQSSISYNAVNFCIKNVFKCQVYEVTENYDTFTPLDI